MKFLIQKINGEIEHDFSFTLLNAIKFNSWLHKEHNVIKYFNTIPEQMEFQFKDMHRTYVPVGSVEFVSGFLVHFYGIKPKPINVPEELFEFANRNILNINHTVIDSLKHGKYFIKSNDKIKGLAEVFKIDDNHVWNFKDGNYQISDVICIDSEWRVFVYQGKMVGLQNYCGEFTKFPCIDAIKNMIESYKSAPIAYTLDVGVNDEGTFVIECHQFMSVGLYGFPDHSILPNMFYRGFKEYVIKNKLK